MKNILFGTKTLILLLATGIWLAAAPMVTAQTLFMTLTDIPGESVVHGHEGEIEVSSLNFGLLSSADSGTGKVQFYDITIQKPVDKSSIPLALKCANGTSITSGHITMFKTGSNGTLTPIYELGLKPLIVTGISVNGTGDTGTPTETVTLRCNVMSWTYCSYNSDGSTNAPIIDGWDAQKNVENTTRIQ